MLAQMKCGLVVPLTIFYFSARNCLASESICENGGAQESKQQGQSLLQRISQFEPSEISPGKSEDTADQHLEKSAASEFQELKVDAGRSLGDRSKDEQLAFQRSRNSTLSKQGVSGIEQGFGEKKMPAPSSPLHILANDVASQIDLVKRDKPALAYCLWVLVPLSLILCATVLYFGTGNYIIKTICLGFTYISLSTAMIQTNKWLMHSDRFPYPMALMTNHMLASWLLANLLRLCCPWAFPALAQLEVTLRFGLKFLFIGALFAVSIVCGNAAYLYLSVAFLQIVKQCNVVHTYVLSVVLGLAALNRCSVVFLTCVLCGVLLTVHGEMHFQAYGFMLQVISSLSEVGKIVTQGILMSGYGKLDPLTLVLFMAPACLLVIVLPFCAIEAPNMLQIQERFEQYSFVIVINATLAFTLNVVVACCIQMVSPVGYVVMGVLKDIIIVSSSAIVMGESLTFQQLIGFTFAVSGVAAYSLYKQNLDCFGDDDIFAGTVRVLKRFQGLEPPHKSFKAENCHKG